MEHEYRTLKVIQVSSCGVSQPGSCITRMSLVFFRIYSVFDLIEEEIRKHSIAYIMKVDDLCYTFIRHHAGFENFKRNLCIQFSFLSIDRS